MPNTITLSKAYEILLLNYKEASTKMPPDVRSSLAVALSALAFVQAARKSGIIAPDFTLQGETLETTGNNTN